MDAREREAFIAWSTLPAFKRKVEKSLSVIKEALELGPAYVAISWGKDSVVMLHLCQQVQPDILAVHIGHDYQDLIDNYSETIELYCQQRQTNHRWIKGDQKNAKEGAFSLRLSQEYPLVFLGLRSEESAIRRKSIGKYGVIHQYQSGSVDGSWRCVPICYWSWQDVWAYIASNDLPCLASYDHWVNADRGRSRTAAHFSSGRGSDFGRLSKIKIMTPDYYRFLKQQIPEIGG